MDKKPTDKRPKGQKTYGKRFKEQKAFDQNI